MTDWVLRILLVLKSPTAPKLLLDCTFRISPPSSLSLSPHSMTLTNCHKASGLSLPQSTTNLGKFWFLP